MVLDWPALNTLVWLRLPCCDAEHPTRVEDFDGDNCVIAEPSAPHTDPVDPARVTNGFFLGWVNGRGALEAPVDLVAVNHEPVPTWTVKAVGPEIETQRRRFVRLHIDLIVKLYILEGGAPTHAQLLDISEGGLRCRVDRWFIDPGEKCFPVEVTLDEQDYYLQGQIMWRSSADETSHREFGIQFKDLEPATADKIRSQIFAAQLAERRKMMDR
jgi:hypothetical protein